LFTFSGHDVTPFRVFIQGRNDNRRSHYFHDRRDFSEIRREERAVAFDKNYATGMQVLFLSCRRALEIVNGFMAL